MRNFMLLIKINGTSQIVYPQNEIEIAFRIDTNFIRLSFVAIKGSLNIAQDTLGLPKIFFMVGGG